MAEAFVIEEYTLVTESLLVIAIGHFPSGQPLVIVIIHTYAGFRIVVLVISLHWIFSLLGWILNSLIEGFHWQ